MKGEESPFLRKGSNWKGELLVCYLNLIQKHVKTDSILQNSGPAPVRQLGRIAAKPKIAVSKIPTQLPPNPEASTAPWCLYSFPKDALNYSDLIKARQHRASASS